jgi:hypothetical protein
MAFKPEFGGQKLSFISPLQWENNLMLYDSSTGHLVQQLTGRILDGPGAGQTLASFPTRIMPWAAWQQLYPDTQVLYHPPQRLFDKLVRKMLKTQIDEPNQRREAPIFPTISHFDSRLPNKAEILGVCVHDACKAYPLTHLKQAQVMNDQLDGETLVIAYDPQRDVGDVFCRQRDGQTLTFDRETDDDGGLLLIDQETGSKWNMAGLAVAGPLAGTQLAPYAHFSRVFWYSWANFHPQTEVAA